MAVLLVVADDLVRSPLFEQLHALRFRVTALATEDEARRYLRSFTPSIVVYHAVDDADGTRRFLADLSVQESGPQTPVLVLSASTAANGLAKACGFMVLPFPADEAELCSELTRLAPQSRRARAG